MYAYSLSTLKMHINTNGDKVQIHWGTEIERQRTGPADGMEKERQWLTGTTLRRFRERTWGWGMGGGWRRRGEINMALIVSSAPLQSLHQPFITPLQSVQCRHFGKWGPPLTPSIKTAATNVGVCVCVCVCLIQRRRQNVCVCVCVCMFEWASACMTYKDITACLSGDEFVSSRWSKKKIQTHFSFSSRLGRRHQSAVLNQMENHQRELYAQCWLWYALLYERQADIKLETMTL